MKLSLFDSFVDMIEAIPTQAIIWALEREGHMLEEDLAYQRPVPPDEAGSILHFCRFIEAVRNEREIECFDINLPARHLEFYWKTVGRLVETKEIPSRGKEKFNNLAANVSLKIVEDTTKDTMEVNLN